MTAPTIPAERAPSGGNLSPQPLEPEAASGRGAGLVIVCVVAAVALIASVIGIGFGMRAIDESKTNVAASSAGAGDGGGSASGVPEMVDVALAEFSVTPKAITVAAGGMLMVTNKGT